MYCTHCGAECSDETLFCTKCGKKLEQNKEGSMTGKDATYVPDDAPSFGYAILGFIIPIVGLILYLVWKDQTPLRAGSAGKGALVSVILTAIVIIGGYVFWGGLIYNY